LETLSEWQFVRRTLIVVAIIAVAAMLWALSDILLIIFGAALTAVVLRVLMRPLLRLGLREEWSLFVVVAALTSAIALFGWMFGSAIWDQSQNLAKQLPEATQNLAKTLYIPSISDVLKGSSIGNLVFQIVTWGTTLFGMVASIVLIAIGGIYFAATPEVYKAGAIKLLPKQWQTRVSAMMNDAGHALGCWLNAQIIAMVLVGTLTGVGMWLVGVPSPIVLGLIAGLTEFIPIVGPLVGAIPAVILASASGWELMLWAIGVAITVQQIENNLIMPYIVGRVVDLSPAVGLFAVVAIGVVFGPLGVILAYPLAIVIDLAIRRLYVKETLGEKVELPKTAAPEAAH
jgi:predicted PurR-regulated permease PerM